MRRPLFFSGAAVLAGTLVGLLASSALDPLEDRVTALKYRLRGERTPDSSVVIVYVDNEAIVSLGWPVRRNFYALMVSALSDLRASAVGIEVQFEQQNQEYPEYDHLLASVSGTAGNIVVASYVGILTPESGESPDGNRFVPQTFHYPRVGNVPHFGTELHLPYPELLDQAAGVGHVNLSGASDFPLFVSFGTGLLPAFPLEVLRIHAGAQRSAVERNGDGVAIPWGAKTIRVPVSSDGLVRVSPPILQSAFTSYPFLEVLKSYDDLKAGRPPGIPVDRLQGKIVLVGIIAEGRTPFVSTPLHDRLPSLLLHAAFIDNALRSSFLTGPSGIILALLCFLAAACTVTGLLLLPAVPGRVVAWGTPILCTAASFVAFTAGSYLLPLLPLLAASLAAGVPAFVYKHRMARAQVATLQGEKEIIAGQLRDREAKVAVLERELLGAAAERSSDRTHELLEEIRKYKTEIRALSARVDDMEEYREAAEASTGSREQFEGIVYSRNGRMRPIVEFVARIAPSEAPVLILGESGTGKELVARALHRRSARGGKPFVAVNCGALAENLLESELFGHDRGAFTGAMKDKPGRFELANGGTVFLDEIGEVSENFQLKLLRVLQEGELERVGGTQTIRVNVRVIAATNRNLKEAVRGKKFREDLFYRLNVLTVEIPPLRERHEDIPLLVHHFLAHEGQDLTISKNVMEALATHVWPGNVRELESAVTRAVLLARSEKRFMITMKDMTPEISSALQGMVALEEQILQSVREKEFSRSAISETASELGGLNRGTVAEYLRGEFFKAFVEHGFRMDDAVLYLSPSAGPGIQDRVRKRLEEYLANLAEGIDPSEPWETSRPMLRPKMKNLPQRYHRYLEQIAEAHFRGLWRLRDGG